MIFKPSKSTGLAIGLTALVLLAGVEIGLVAFSRPALPSRPAPLAFVALCFGLASLPVIVFIGYRCYGLARGRYILSRNALVIDWGWRRELIPMVHIRAVQVVTEPGELAALRPRGVWWPGCLVGSADLPETGPVEFLAATQTQGLVLVHCAERTLALSPVDPRTFAETFSQLQAEGPSAQIEPESVVPVFPGWALLRAQPAFALPVVTSVSGLLLIGYLLLTLPGRVDGAGTPLNVFSLSIIVALTWVLNTLFGLWLRRRPAEQPMAYLVWGATAFTQALVWGAVISQSVAGR
jgi:hypothetical protein